jgi:hypothetical protein
MSSIESKTIEVMRPVEIDSVIVSEKVKGNL